MSDLIARLDADELHARQVAQYVGEGWLYALDALRKVLELHKPLNEDADYTECVTCLGSYVAWPCPTRKALAEAYGIEVPA